MSTVLIAYASTHGHTAKIARRIADRLQADGVPVETHDVGGGADPDPSVHDAVVVAASVHRGSHQQEAIAWAKRHRGELAAMPGALVSVSLTAADDSEDARATTARLVREFARESGWTPDRELSVAGALQYREYDVFTRTLMRLLMRRGGHPTDASHDHDFTDWQAVDDFAADLARLAPPAPAGA